MPPDDLCDLLLASAELKSTSFGKCPSHFLSPAGRKPQITTICKVRKSTLLIETSSPLTWSMA